MFAAPDVVRCVHAFLRLQGSVVMTVLIYLLGGGNSFSSGGPGKGMHSRLYTRVLNYHHWVHSCSSYSQTFNNTGLLGIQASCDPPKAQHMLDVMCSEWLAGLARVLSPRGPAGDADVCADRPEATCHTVCPHGTSC